MDEKIQTAREAVPYHCQTIPQSTEPKKSHPQHLTIAQPRVQENYDYVLGYLKHVLKTRGNMQVVTTGEMLNRPELCRLSAADKQNVDSSGELQCYSSR